MRGLKIAGVVALIALAGCSGSSEPSDAGTDALELDASTQLDRYCSAECGGTAVTCGEDEVCVCSLGLFAECYPTSSCIWPPEPGDSGMPCPLGEWCPSSARMCPGADERCVITAPGGSHERQLRAMDKSTSRNCSGVSDARRRVIRGRGSSARVLLPHQLTSAELPESSS